MQLPRSLKTSTVSPIEIPSRFASEAFIVTSWLKVSRSQGMLLKIECVRQRGCGLIRWKGWVAVLGELRLSQGSIHFGIAGIG